MDIIAHLVVLPNSCKYRFPAWHTPFIFGEKTYCPVYYLSLNDTEQFGRSSYDHCWDYVQITSYYIL